MSRHLAMRSLQTGRLGIPGSTARVSATEKVTGAGYSAAETAKRTASAAVGGSGLDTTHRLQQVFDA